MEAEKLSQDKPYYFRAYSEMDVPFIQNSWGTSYYHGLDSHKLLSSDEFHKRHRPIRERFLNNPDATIIVCCSKEDKDLIIGWIGVEKPETSRGLILHYLYVKHAFKNEGIATELLQMALPDRPVLYTHLTNQAKKILFKHKGSGRFERFIHLPHIV